MATIQDILESAMGKIGAVGPGDPIEADDLNLCLKRLNTLIDSLNGNDFFAYASIETIVSLPGGTASMTIGPAMTIDIARPVKILANSFVRLDSRDYSLTPLSEAEFNKIVLKSLQSHVPRYCCFDGNVPTGTIAFYPAAAQTVELHLFTPERMTETTAITTLIVLPPGYRLYLENALAVQIYPDFFPGKAVPADLKMAALNEKRAVRKANHRVPQLEFDDMNPVVRDTANMLFGV